MYAKSVAVVVVFVLGWGIGSGLTKGRYEARLHDAARMHRVAQDAAVARASEELAAESKRAVSAAEERGRRSVAAREVIHEIHIAPDARDCGWTDDQRLRIERIYAAHGANSSAADGVPDAVRPAAEDIPAARSVGG